MAVHYPRPPPLLVNGREGVGECFEVSPLLGMVFVWWLSVCFAKETETFLRSI